MACMFDRLRKWRKEQALEANLPLYTIALDVTLRGLSSLCEVDANVRVLCEAMLSGEMVAAFALADYLEDAPAVERHLRLYLTRGLRRLRKK